jgi:hypothetical protein
LERGPIHKENVESTVVVVIKKSDACTHGFRQVMLGRMRREVIEVDSESGGNVGESSRERLL